MSSFSLLPAFSTIMIVTSIVVACCGDDVQPHSINLSELRIIPRIIHHAYLDGISEFERKVTQGVMNRSRYESCVREHPDWHHMFWEAPSADLLVKTRYPWFLETWQSYDRVVLKADALRYMLLHSFGGLYVDLDVECLAPADPTMIHGIVLQGTGSEGVTNFAMAGAPGHPFWIEILKVCRDHSVLVNPDIPGFRTGNDDPLIRTGPRAVRKAFELYFKRGPDGFMGIEGQVKLLISIQSIIKLAYLLLRRRVLVGIT